MANKGTGTATAAMPGVKIISSGEIDPAELVVDPEFNGRRYQGEVNNMAKSLMSEGQKQPIRIREKDGRKHVVFGNRRALGALQITTQGLLAGGAPFMLRYEEVDLDDAAAYIENLIENKEREDLSIIDHAHNYMRLTAEPFNMSQRDVAKRLGISDALVSRALTLVKGVKDHPPLSAKHQKLVHLKKIPTETAYALVPMEEEEREVMVAAIMAGNTVTAADAKAKTGKRKAGNSKADADATGSKALTAKMIRLPFEEVVTKWPEAEEQTPYVKLCDLIVRVCNGKLKAKTALKQIKDLVGE